MLSFSVPAFNTFSTTATCPGNPDSCPDFPGTFQYEPYLFLQATIQPGLGVVALYAQPLALHLFIKVKSFPLEATTPGHLSINCLPSPQSKTVFNRP